jgi:transcription termination factor Rho
MYPIELGKTQPVHRLRSCNKCDEVKPPEAASGAEEEGPFCLSKFALNGRSDVMRERMLSDVYVIGKIAILGQTTVIYAPPNAGKTLITIALLIQTIKNQTLPPEDILYINADDNAKGLLQKLVLAEKYGFFDLTF